MTASSHKALVTLCVWESLTQEGLEDKEPFATSPAGHVTGGQPTPGIVKNDHEPRQILQHQNAIDIIG